ncbi:hypothetical protein APSETT445_002988 [Aspergillus pseudonomiae]
MGESPPALGYLAPIGAGILVISVCGDVDKQFPQMKYSDWWAGQSRKGSIAKETIGSLGSVSKDAKDNETDIIAPEAHAQKTDSTENTQSDKAQEHFCDSGNACEHGSDDAASESGCLCAICMDSIEGYESPARPKAKAGNLDVVKFGPEKSTHEARCFVKYWPLTLISCTALPKLQAGVVIDMLNISGHRVIRHMHLTQTAPRLSKAYVLLKNDILGIQTANRQFVHCLLNRTHLVGPFGYNAFDPPLPEPA